MNFPKIPTERSDDIHNFDFLDDNDLSLFVAGNQFMAMPELIAAFQTEHPEVQKIFYETLPPRLELKQILAGGARFGDRILPGRPDIYASVSKTAMTELEAAGLIDSGDYRVYLHNRIVLMVREGNPLGIQNVADLARDDVRVSQPNPEYEDIALHIVKMYLLAGGETLVHRIMEEKRAEATTILTMVHHRETPLRLVKGTCDVGPVWATEWVEAARKNLPLAVVEPGRDLDRRDAVNYYIARLKDAKNKDNAAKFIAFIQSPAAKAIYRKFGFVPHE